MEAHDVFERSQAAAANLAAGFGEWAIQYVNAGLTGGARDTARLAARNGLKALAARDDGEVSE